VTSLHGHNQALKILWKIADNAKSRDGDRMHAISLIRDLYAGRVQLMNAKPILDAIEEGIRSKSDFPTSSQPEFRNREGTLQA